jgi:hypothetical protein
MHAHTIYLFIIYMQWPTQDFFQEGGSANSVEDRGQRERVSGGVSPLVKGSAQLQMSETHILIRLLRMYVVCSKSIRTNHST